jgi:hypothetical protein
VRCEISIPSFVSSPWMRGAPHNGLALAMWHTSARISFDTKDVRRARATAIARSKTYEILRGANAQRSHDYERVRPGRQCGGQPHPEQTIDATESPSFGLSMQRRQRSSVILKSSPAPLRDDGANRHRRNARDEFHLR